jgi:GTPase SAR1 family protein
MGMLLNREKLLSQDEFKIEKVEFENGDFVYVREMSGRGRDNFGNSLMKVIEDKNEKSGVRVEQTISDYRAKLAVCTLCDEKGVLLLKPNDYEALSNNISTTKLERIAVAATKINAITKEDQDDMVKNSEPGQIEDLHSVSAGN